MDDPELDDWLAGLRGERNQNPANDEALALRQAILAQRVATDADEPAQLERLVAHLRQEGALPHARRRPSSARVWALAASVAFVAVCAGIVFRTSHPGLQQYPPEEMRGTVGGVTVVSAQPQQMAAQVQRELQAIGVSSHLLPDSQRTLIEATVTERQLPAFSAWMEAHGGVARATGTYRIGIVPP